MSKKKPEAGGQPLDPQAPPKEKTEYQKHMAKWDSKEEKLKKQSALKAHQKFAKFKEQKNDK